MSDEKTIADRDRDWILAIGHALGMESGFDIPIIPEVEPFKHLFAQVRGDNVVQLHAETTEENETDELFDTVTRIEQRLGEIEENISEISVTLDEKLEAT